LGHILDLMWVLLLLLLLLLPLLLRLLATDHAKRCMCVTTALAVFSSSAQEASGDEAAVLHSFKESNKPHTVSKRWCCHGTYVSACDDRDHASNAHPCHACWRLTLCQVCPTEWCVTSQ
jgi:hypothetical protein